MRRREESAVKIWLANVRLSTWLGSVVASGAFRAATEGGLPSSYLIVPRMLFLTQAELVAAAVIVLRTYL